MWEAFKILLLCLFSIFIASLSDSWLFICAVLLVLVVFLYDFDFSTGLERHAISKLKYSHLKVRNLYTAIFQREQNISSFQFTPTMNSVNKQTSSFDLSRFNKSGNALSPISNSSSTGAFSSRRLIQSRQTSTPLTRTSPWQKNSVSPANNVRSSAFHNSMTNRSPRYSLSSLTPKSGNNESPVKPTIQTVTGPLLASTRFNVNLGTYTDTKSPGLASRVVQYHNELSGNQTSTHQTKYGSPGQFPIVQLYKKELPILGRSARRCTVRIAPPDPVSYNSDHANTILRDSFVQNNNDNASRQNDTEINTRSVLEALKEISRKRIHTNDDIDDISKRQRKNSVSSSGNSSMHFNKDGKRMREDTPPKPKETCTTPVNSAPKRICVVNEIESSLSSSRLMRLQQGQKRKSTLNIPESNKQRRVANGELISRETQTTITNGSKSTAPENNKKDTQKTTSTAAQTESEIGSGMLDIQQILDSTRRKKKSKEIRSTRDIDEENSTLQFAKANTAPTKSIFSEAPLEIMKQNKLSVMLSALAGREPEIIPLPDMTLSALKKKSEDHPDGTDIINREVVSILSPKNKPKHDKHVTFAIPNSDSSNDTTSATFSKQLETVSKDNSDAGSALPLVSSITTNNVSNATTNVAFSGNLSSPSFGTSLQANASSPLTFSTVASVSSNVAPTSSPRNNFMFGSVSPPNNYVTLTTNSTNIITSSGVDISENSPNKNTMSFGSAPPNFNFGANNSAKPPGFGGLVPSSQPIALTKIDDKTSATTSATAAGFQISSPSVAAPTSTPIMFGSPASSSFNPLNPTSNTSAPQAVINFGAKSAFTSPASTAASAVKNVVSFNPVSSQQTTFLPANTNFTTAAPVTSTTSAPGMFSLGAKSEAKTTASSSFSFGASTPVASQSQPKSGGFKFDLGKSVATTIATPKSEAPKPSMFGTGGSSSINKSGAFSFGSSNATTSAKTTTTNSAPAFGIQNTTTSTPSFGTPNKTITGGMFGTPTTTASTAVFGTPTTTSTGVFGAPTTTASTAVFGTPSTTTSTAVFGTPTTTSTGVFGAPTTTASTGVFGTPSTTSAAVVFGATGATSGTFGAPSTSTSVPAFGSSNAAPNTGVFGSTSSAPAFGASKTTENPPSFGAFGASSSAPNPGFGATPQNSSTFGFGTPTTTQQNTAPAFGSNPPTTTTSSFSFGSNSAAKPFAFGSTTTTTTTAPTMFGSTSTTTASNVFGGNATSGFGSASAAPSTFGGTAATTAQNNFGQQQPSSSFGTASSNFGTGTSGSAFGTNNNNNTFGSSTSSNVFGAQQTNTFGSGPSTQASVFGGNNNNNNQGSGSVFGATNAPNNNNSNTFGQTSNAAFGSGFSNNNAQSSGIGNFGSPAAQTPGQPSSIFTFGGAAASSSATPGASNAFQFGAGSQTPKPSGFNFSANANASTPNINFGSGAPPAFNATPTPAFGSPAPGQFNTPAPSTGMFNIGSGSTAPKQRPMIKARRRN